MATVYTNIKGVKFLEEPVGANRGGVALVTFDNNGTLSSTAGDVLQLGGSGFDAGVATTATLATIIQNRRRDGRTVVLSSGQQGPFPGLQGSQLVYTTGIVTNLSNVTCAAFSTATSTALAITSTAMNRACSVLVSYTASFPGASPE